MIEVDKFIKALKEWQISFSADEYLHIQLTGGDKTARAHYQQIIRENSLLEDLLIYELAEHDEKLMAKFIEANFGALWTSIYG